MITCMIREAKSENSIANNSLGLLTIDSRKLNFKATNRKEITLLKAPSAKPQEYIQVAHVVEETLRVLSD